MGTWIARLLSFLKNTKDELKFEVSKVKSFDLTSQVACQVKNFKVKLCEKFL